MKTIILGVLLLFPLNLGFAQSETGRAVIAGSVSDPDNNFVSGAGVTIRETQTGMERKLQTDSNGQFRAALQVGTYTEKQSLRDLAWRGSEIYHWQWAKRRM